MNRMRERVMMFREMVIERMMMTIMMERSRGIL